MNKVVVFGPGPMFKGGIANYTISLAKALDKLENTKVYIVSWTNQYPSIIPRDFVDKSSKTDLLEGTDINVIYVTDYNKPNSWNKTVEIIKNIDPQKVIFQWAIAIQGLPMGYIAKKLKKTTKAEIIFDLHVVKQKESSIIDKAMLKEALKIPDTFIVHALKTYDELKELFPNKNYYLSYDGIRSNEPDTKNVLKLYHPIYDMFTPDPNLDVEKLKQEIGLNKYVFLFFGFIRKYKGLHNVILAFNELLKRRKDVSLLIVGESFWHTLDKRKLSTKIKKIIFNVLKKILLRKSDDESNYNPLALVDELNLHDYVKIFNQYIPNEDVHKYFQISNVNVLFYLTATPSGVESISYNFHMPIVATKVGHFPETIQEGYNGYLAEPNDIISMADAMEKAITNPIDRNNVKATAEKMSWENYAKTIMKDII
ncbi:MAG TPA: glycosyltransferase [Ignavibacteriales bacterium]|nr:glycosyltransferase [Ignavibacteriales bacterium]HRV32472.1 glycosyltransferase [Candidatus Paceibacterota bacterium]HOL81952.1 glycosyltransferase [Ignavibacteriales bacterium]HOM65924.1 glycosyltransferase [Ignavibacteriales bacterium]HPD68583.1 glycosyltransferase [Ignavibacteriales bacterium]